MVKQGEPSASAQAGPRCCKREQGPRQEWQDLGTDGAESCRESHEQQENGRSLGKTFPVQQLPQPGRPASARGQSSARDSVSVVCHHGRAEAPASGQEQPPARAAPARGRVPCPHTGTLSSPELCSGVEQQHRPTVMWGAFPVFLAFLRTRAFSSNRRDVLLRAHTHAHARTSFYMSFLSSWIKSRAAKLPVLCHVTLIASRSHHILNSCGFSGAIYLMQFAKCLRSSADSDILGLQSFAI